MEILTLFDEWFPLLSAKPFHILLLEKKVTPSFKFKWIPGLLQLKAVEQKSHSKRRAL